MKIWNRVYSDFLLPERFTEYEEVLQFFKSAGFQFLTASDCFQIHEPGQYMVLRHDIDTDPQAALKFATIEKKLGVTATYYFRLATEDRAVIQELDRSGFEVGYHFEELADVVKRAKSSANLNQKIESARDLFLVNLEGFRKRNQVKVTSVSSHGDFMNRRIKHTNSVLINDRILRKGNLLFEYYQENFINRFSHYFSDYHFPNFYRPNDPRSVAFKTTDVVTFLTHPRHWRSNWSVNLKDNVCRLVDEVRYRGITS